MKNMSILLLALVLSTSLYSFDKLEVGDLIFTTYRPCHVCQMIEDETQSSYSHLGIVIERDKKGGFWVAEARGLVRKIPLAQFLAQATIIDIYRLKSTALLRPYSFSAELRKSFSAKFEGLSYDHAFLWDNIDSKGRESLYCSEFISKLLNPLLHSPIQIRPMSFLTHYPRWVDYFKPLPVPQGEYGNNPQSLFDDLDLVFVATLSENDELVEE